MKVISFTDYAPIPRYDSVPWMGARINQQAYGSTDWVQIDEIAFTPTDPDPANPIPRSFSTPNVSIAEGYIKIVFFDENEVTQETDPLYYTSASTPIGKIALSVRSLLPVTWDRLAASDWYGADLLLSRIEVAKNKIFPAAIAAQDESAYTALMMEYVASNAALEIIPAGIEYWAQQKTSKSATGTNETITYVDRVAALTKLAERLQKEVASLAGNPNLTAFMNSVNEVDVPDVSGNDDSVLITENPYDMNPAFTSQVPGA